MQIKVEKERALSGSEYTLCHLIAIYLGSVMLICPTSHFLIQAIYTSKWFFFYFIVFLGVGRGWWGIQSWAQFTRILAFLPLELKLGYGLFNASGVRNIFGPLS